MLSRKKDFIRMDDFKDFLVLVILWSDFQHQLMILDLNFIKSLCLVLLTPAGTSLKSRQDNNNSN